MKNDHSQQEIDLILREILLEFIEEEGELIEMNINERTLSASLCCYIKRHVAFEGWNIDCEYNRDGICIPKRSDSEENNCIIPDIVIHRRWIQWVNYIAIELKKAPVLQREKDKDIRTLQALKDKYNYKHCIFLEISSEIQKIEFN